MGRKQRIGNIKLRLAACDGKQAYTTFEEGMRIKRVMEIKRDLRFNLYKCAFCSSFHIGKIQNQVEDISSHVERIRDMESWKDCSDFIRRRLASEWLEQRNDIRELRSELKNSFFQLDKLNAIIRRQEIELAELKLKMEDET